MARQFTRGPRRKTQWGGFGSASGAAALPDTVDLVAGTAVILSQAIIVSGAAGLLDEEVTITRTLGFMNCGIRSATAEAEATVAIGLAVARAEAIVAGVASLPSPEDDPDFEWLFYGVYPLRNAVAAQLGSNGSGFFQGGFDVRGQRVLRSGQSVVWLAESQSSNAWAGVGGRYLVKLT